MPGYRINKQVLPPDPAFLERGVVNIAAAAAKAVAVIRNRTPKRRRTRAYRTRDQSRRNHRRFQDKVRIDPSEENTYSRRLRRQVFESGGLKFGVVICHEGWRYPEAVRYAAQRGARRLPSAFS